MPREVNKVQLVIREFGAEVCGVLGDARKAQEWLRAFHDGLVYGLIGRSAFADRLRAEAGDYLDLMAEAGRAGGLAKSRNRKFQAVRVSGSGDAPVPGTSGLNARPAEASTGPDREFLPGGAPSGNAGEPSAATTAHGQDIATRTRAGESADKGTSSNGPANGGSARGGRPDVPGATEFISSAPDPAPARSRKNLPELGEFRNVRISDGEMAALVSEFGDVSAVVEELSSYKAATGKCYKNDYAALRNWLRRRNAEGKRPDGTKRTQGDRLAQIFAERERRIRNGDVPEDLLGM